MNSINQEDYKNIYFDIESFLTHMRKNAEHLTIEDKQKILRLVVKEILVGPDTITIVHSIPISSSSDSRHFEISRLRSCYHGRTVVFRLTTQ